jgi:hypothetical protein
VPVKKTMMNIERLGRSQVYYSLLKAEEGGERKMRERERVERDARAIYTTFFFFVIIK